MTTVQKRNAGSAKASLVLGILGLVLIGPLGSIPAIICGHVAKSKIKKDPATLTGDGMALAGLILGYVQIGLMVVLLPLSAAIALPSFVRARDLAQTNACINNLRQIEYAKEIWGMENAVDTGAVVPSAAYEIIRDGMPTCPAGGTYTLGPLGTPPTCSEPGHALPSY